ncbi:MAG: NADH:ubiquinone reductase (Na(+)-transporting) subunit C [Myxococcota bacterium]|nr:NADH:ubiquinone reductase (Na(+)-transporting) subunit C [Myxococcota bacterium]
MQLDSTGYIVGFAGAVCLVASVFVSGAAVALKDKQDANKILDQQKKVLTVSGLIQDANDSGSNDDEVGALEASAVQGFFSDGSVSPEFVKLPGAQGDCESLDLVSYDQKKATKEPSMSFEVEANDAKVTRLPNCAKVYRIKTDDGERLILPITAPGLWSTLYGFMAVDAADGNTVKGLIFYEHGETPGLGGEVDNSRWRGLWPGRKIFDGGSVALGVKKGQAGTPAEDPYNVDGLSGATLTSNGVTKGIHFWMGEAAYGPLLAEQR